VQGYETETSIVAWLKALDIIPQDVQRMSIEDPIVGLNPDRVPVRYLGSVAFEWDSWGPSTPTQFLDALVAETAGTRQRDIIVATLTSLGQSVAEEDVNDVTYRLRLAS
jgi:hypothetical protein